MNVGQRPARALLAQAGLGLAVATSARLLADVYLFGGWIAGVRFHLTAAAWASAPFLALPWLVERARKRPLLVTSAALLGSVGWACTTPAASAYASGIERGAAPLGSVGAAFQALLQAPRLVDLLNPWVTLPAFCLAGAVLARGAERPLPAQLTILASAFLAGAGVAAIYAAAGYFMPGATYVLLLGALPAAALPICLGLVDRCWPPQAAPADPEG